MLFDAVAVALSSAWIGTVLGVVSWNRKGANAWWITGVMVLNICRRKLGRFTQHNGIVK